MTKTTTTEPKIITKLRAILEGHTAAKIDGMLMDAFTASMLIQVYDALNETNRAKFAGLPLLRMVDIGWKAVRK